MKKNKKKVNSLLIGAISLFLGGSIPANYLIDNFVNSDLKVKSTQLNWTNYNLNQDSKLMENSYYYIKDFKLTELNWFGSHDSGTYGSGSGSLGMDAKENGFINFINSIGMYSNIWKLAKMQVNSIKDQLKEGVRYLDLRISTKQTDKSFTNYTIDDMYITHTSLFEKFTNIVSQINDFIKENPNEMILIDINHWYPSDLNNGNMQQKVLDYFVKVFGNKLATTDNYNLTDNFGKFIDPKNPQNNKNILLFFTGSRIKSNYVYNSLNSKDLNYIGSNASSGNKLISYWTGDGVYHTKDIISKIDSFLETKKQHSNNIYVVQAIPNWDGWQYFSGCCQGATGFQMDNWWNIGNDVTNYFINKWYTKNTESKYDGLVVMVNNASAKKNNILNRIRWSFQNKWLNKVAPNRV